TDQRGLFLEVFHIERYHHYRIPAQFVQDNISRSQQGVLRGLHYQIERPQGKLIYVTHGSVFDVVVDVRQNSPTFGRAIWIELNDVNHRQLYIPPGFAHGFCALSETVDFTYKCTDYFHPSSEGGILWNDPDLNIPWPLQNPILSAKDAAFPRLKDIPTNKLL
ncbi:MAG TPA: dTDP-4-dehydrorhamnose 3,5-epimerase, partial [Hanamia sp.]|nr:dTDP-4-dehydrorhamnose 3,5-epimerase [Hanamia sp.]